MPEAAKRKKSVDDGSVEAFVWLHSLIAKLGSDAREAYRSRHLVDCVETISQLINENIFLSRLQQGHMESAIRKIVFGPYLDELQVLMYQMQIATYINSLRR